MPQTATTGQLDQAQRTVIATERYTEEHNSPCYQLIEKMKLQGGERQVDVPKVGQMSVYDLVDGQDIVDEEEIGMTFVSLTTSEVGSKIIITDKLARQSQPSIFKMVGRQLGDGKVRKREGDIIALYPGLNGGTSLGAAAAALSPANYAAAIANARGKTSDPFNPTYCVHHPHAVYNYVKESTAIGASTEHWPESWQREKLANFWSQRSFNGVALFQSGNIPVDASDDAIGVLAAQDALVVLESYMSRVERQRDISLRGVEVVITCDYGVFELDDTKGYPMTFDAAAPSTTA